MKKSLCALSALALSAMALPGHASSLNHAGNGGDEANETFFYRTNTPKKSNATTGRWLYTGTVPRFDSKHLEIFVSKVGLTARVHAWVPAEMPEQYGEYLLKRYQRIHDAFAPNSGTYFENLQSVEELLAKASESEKAWLQVDAQYLRHELEGRDADVFGAKDKTAYDKEILTALARSYLDDNSMTIDKMLDSAKRAAAGDQAFLAEFRAKSKALFNKRFGDRFTPVNGTGTRFNGSQISGVIGTIDFVFPIAATADGPFSIPAEGVHQFPIDGTVEARWWSDKWADEYGGLPFLMFTTSAIAFHGPITHAKTMDIWFVKRDFASHGCHRMNASDIMELRALIPSDAVSKTAGDIPLYEMAWMDVIETGGKKQVVDVAYYEVPDSVSARDVERYKGDSARNEWYRKHYSKYDGQVDGSKESFDPSSQEFFGIPQYGLVGNALKRVGFYKDGIPIKTFAYHPVKVIQYREDGVKLSGYNDDAGKYPPGYFELPSF